MNFKFYIFKLKTLIITGFILLMLLAIMYVGYSIFFAENYGTFV